MRGMVVFLGSWLSSSFFFFLTAADGSGHGSIVPRHNCSGVKVIPVSGDVVCECTLSNSEEPFNGTLVWLLGKHQVFAAGRHGVRSLLFPSENLTRYHMGMEKWCQAKFSDGSTSSAVSLSGGVAYGPDNVTIRYDNVNDTEGTQYIRIICDVSVFYPMAVDMIQWSGQCQGQEGVVCLLTPEEADGKEVGCRVTNYVNGNRTVETAVNISLDRRVASGWDGGQTILKTAASGVRNSNDGLRLTNCDSHADSEFISLRSFIGLAPSSLAVGCDGLSDLPGSTVHWTLATDTGHTLDLGTCADNNCTPKTPNVQIRRIGALSSVKFEIYPREWNGQLTCTERSKSDVTRSATCPFGYVYPATWDGCQYEIQQTNWTLVIQCNVRRLYPLHAYVFNMTEFHRKAWFGSPIISKKEFPTAPMYLTTPYINKTHHRLYYDVTTIYRRSLSAVNDMFYMYQLSVFPGFHSPLSLTKYQLHVVRPAQPVINCTRSVQVCFCSTTFIGSPAGRLLWLLGERVLATSQYGVTYLEFPIEEVRVPEEGLVINCYLDWIEGQTFPYLLQRGYTSVTGSSSTAAFQSNRLRPGTLKVTVTASSAVTNTTKLMNRVVVETPAVSISGHSEGETTTTTTTTTVLAVGAALVFLLIAVIGVVLLVVLRRGGGLNVGRRRKGPRYWPLPPVDPTYPAGQTSNPRLRHHIPSAIVFENAFSGTLQSLDRIDNSLSTESLAHTYSSIPDDGLYEVVEINHLARNLAQREAPEGSSTSPKEMMKSLAAAVNTRNKNGLRRVESEPALHGGGGDGGNSVYLTPINDCYLTPINDCYLTPVNDCYLTPVNDCYLTPVNDCYLTPLMM